MSETEPVPLIDPRRIVAELEETLIRGQADAWEAHRIAPNSYGAGWDNGYIDGLRLALRLLRGEP